MALREILFPQERTFFDLLERESSVVLRGTEALRDYLQAGAGVDPKPIKDIEHEGDLVVHEIFERVNATFITPIDREDLGRLASALDDVLDFAWATANHVHLYNVKPTPALVELGTILHAQMGHLNKAVLGLRSLRNVDVARHLVEVHRLENAADDIKNRSVAELFRGSYSPLDVIKFKDVYEAIEMATDKCEDAADVIRDTLVKYA
ncbi:MAG TPA: DUF47 family protein [Candidatus Thermoplasmatota archaeon]|nr:DUF47 family protein [Candidatus Thermoplasmatota archaeon]